ncbi:MAG: HEAT repeat domain-containing protein, partial [Cytophagaceae bacterium]|nr:HEAT repeat domain-containing protein [Gemmatimonadaceae bacterium]
MDVITSARLIDSKTPSELFVHELAHLVWLLVYRPGFVDEQKSVLRSLRGVARKGAFRVVQSELAAAVAEASTQVRPPDGQVWRVELSTRMAFHTVRSIDTTAAVTATDLLGLARALASAEGSDEPGAGFDSQFVALASAAMTVELGRHGFSRAATPAHGVPAYGTRPARTPPTGMTSVETAVREPGYGAAALKPSALSPMAGANARPHIIQRELMPAARVDDVVIRLRGEITPQAAPVLFDEVTRLLEDHARDGAWAELIELAAKVMEREATITHPDVKRGASIVLKRLAKPGILRGVALLLPRHRDLRNCVQAFLLRQGDPAVDVLIELLVSADTSGERRAYRDALRQLPAATGPLQQLLKDHRWYVVRNAAELLGEMHAVAADQALIDLLKHSDARVRHAATLSLVKLGTPRAVQTILRALADPDASLRLKAAHGLGHVTHPGVVPGLVSALDRETDEATAHAILHALAHHPVDTAIQRIVHESTTGSLLKRRPVPRRLAATQALGEAKTDVARTALRSLAKDRERSVRE